MTTLKLGDGLVDLTEVVSFRSYVPWYWKLQPIAHFAAAAAGVWVSLLLLINGSSIPWLWGRWMFDDFGQEVSNSAAMLAGSNIPFSGSIAVVAYLIFGLFTCVLMVAALGLAIWAGYLLGTTVFARSLRQAFIFRQQYAEHQIFNILLTLILGAFASAVLYWMVVKGFAATCTMYEGINDDVNHMCRNPHDNWKGIYSIVIFAVFSGLLVLRFACNLADINPNIVMFSLKSGDSVTLRGISDGEVRQVINKLNEEIAARASLS